MKKKKMTGTQMLAELGYEPSNELDGLAAHFVRINEDGWVDEIEVDSDRVTIEFLSGMPISGMTRTAATAREIRAVAALLDELEEQGAMQE